MAPKKLAVYRPKSNPTHRRFNPKDKWAELYDDAWKAYRARFLRVNRKCYVCDAPATVIDHITPAQGNVSVFEDVMNHLPLCATDHNRITAMFDRYHVTGKSIERKLKWIADQRLARGLFTRVKVLPSYREKSY